MRGVVIAWAALLAAASPAAAQVQPYDGSNPFDCTIQNVGFGTAYPDPGADPFCVEFDKRRQNFTEFGIADFMAQEPARVAAASPKCFYYQRDHWTSRVVQEDETTELYNWDGAYYFDKARGTGGTYVENFTFNNQTSDPRLVPGFPDEYKPHFGPGRGGFQAAAGGVEPDPSCVEKAARKSPYAKTPGGPAAGGAAGCLAGHGSIRRGVPGARLGSPRARVLGVLGRPTRRRGTRMRWCTAGGGQLLAAFARRGRKRLRLVSSSAPAYDLRRVAAGDTARYARRRLRRERVVRRGRRVRLLVAVRRRVTHVVRLRSGRVRAVGARTTRRAASGRRSRRARS